MADNNVNIVHVEAVEGLLSEVGKNLAKIVPDKSNANVFSEQTIALEKAIEELNMFQKNESYKLRKAFE